MSGESDFRPLEAEEKGEFMSEENGLSEEVTCGQGTGSYGHPHQL